jgi:sugar lactone lactonase YvrE
VSGARAEIVATGVPFGEGPAWCRDGTLVVTSVAAAGLTTNCCFGGPDLRTLYATDAIVGTVVAWEGMPTPGLPLATWPGLTDSRA